MNGNDVFIQQIRTAPSILSSAETMAVNSQEPKLQTGSAKPGGNTCFFLSIPFAFASYGGLG